MIEKALSPASIQSMLQTMRAAQSDAAGGIEQGNLSDKPLQGTRFADLVHSTLNEVNTTQLEARDLQLEYERGGKIPLTDVVLGMQKSSLAFEATLQVRNKVLKAYDDILNMPV